MPRIVVGVEGLVDQVEERRVEGDRVEERQEVGVLGPVVVSPLCPTLIGPKMRPIK